MNGTFCCVLIVMESNCRTCSIAGIDTRFQRIKIVCWACLTLTQYTVPEAIATLKSITHDAFNGMAWLLVFELSRVSQEGLTILTCLLLLLAVFGENFRPDCSFWILG
jgi:hypothetical protein